MKKIIDYAHEILLSNLASDSNICDMTIGNGKDTLFLCKHFKYVYGFDIQPIALSNTNNLLKEHRLTNYELHLDNFVNIDLYIKNKIQGFIYNLGYLPNGDKKVTTLAKDTLKSLKKALKLLDNEGLIVLVIYSGHEQGKIESQRINYFVKKLSQKEYDVITYKFINQINNPPYVIVIERKN